MSCSVEHCRGAHPILGKLTYELNRISLLCIYIIIFEIEDSSYSKKYVSRKALQREGRELVVGLSKERGG